MPLLPGVRRVLWFACVCLTLFVSRADAADRLLTADFDGDGKRDWVAIDRSEPSVVHVWLSATRSTDVIRSPRAVLRIAATDVDGDHRPELIATDASAAGLRIWKKEPRRGFRAYLGWRAQSHATCSSRGKATDDDPADAEESLPGSADPHDSALTGEPPPGLFDGCVISARQRHREVASNACPSPCSPRAPPAFLT